METHISYTTAQKNLGKVFDQIIDDSDMVFVKHRGRPAVVFLPADQLEQMQQEIARLQHQNIR